VVPAGEAQRTPRASARRTPREYVVLAIVLLVAIPVPYLAGTPSEQQIAVQIVLFALLGTAWNLMSGFAGQFSFGHAAYFGVGAYTSAVLVIEAGLSPWLGMLAGGALAASFGALTAYLSFRYRLRGIYFALATFAFAEILRLLVLNLEALKAAVGYRIPLPSSYSYLTLQFPLGSPNYYWMALVLFGASMVAVIALMRSRTGRFIVAVRDDEEAAAAAGVRVTRTKLVAVAVSAFLTGVGGAYYLQFFLFIDPDLAFGSNVSVQILLPAIIGGIGTVWGPPIGAIVFVAIGELSRGLVESPPSALGFLEGQSGIDLMIYGAILVALVLFLPKGLYGSATEAIATRRRRGRR
jgi:branched-chain amino acid transport system permease protein